MADPKQVKKHEKRRDSVLERMLNTPPAPNEHKSKKNKEKQAQRK